MEKRRISDLAIHIPSSPFDIRLSVSEEIPISSAPDASISPHLVRFKDRLSYGIDGFLLDLTMVKSCQGSQKSTSYELEIEWNNPCCDDQLIQFNLLDLFQM